MWTRARIILGLRCAPTREQTSRALELLEQEPWSPTHWGWMSDDRRPYAREAMLSWMYAEKTNLVGFEPTARRWMRPAHKLILTGLHGKRAQCDVMLLPPASPSDIEALFALAESLAAVFSVELGGVSIDGWPGHGEVYTGPSKIDLPGIRALGLDDLFPRTFFGPRLWDQVAKVLDRGGSRALANGVTLVDFASQPWNAAPPAVEGSLLDAKTWLADAGLSPSENLDPGVHWVPLEEG